MRTNGRRRSTRALGLLALPPHAQQGEHRQPCDAGGNSDGERHARLMPLDLESVERSRICAPPRAAWLVEAVPAKRESGVSRDVGCVPSCPPAGDDLKFGACRVRIVAQPPGFARDTEHSAKRQLLARIGGTLSKGLRASRQVERAGFQRAWATTLSPIAPFRKEPSTARPREHPWATPSGVAHPDDATRSG